MTNALHSSKSNEWYTPSWIVKMIHEVLGQVDLDPASSLVANQRIKAKRIFTQNDDSLNLTWSTEPQTIYLNPPGGKIGNKSQTALFWQKLIDFRNQGLLTEAIFMGFSLEHMAVTQGCTDSICNFPVCIPRKRIKFVSPSGESNSPTHSNVICYLPSLKDNTRLFTEVFSEIGAIMLPSQPATK